MSDHWYILIPTIPNYVPNEVAQEAALTLFTSCMTATNSEAAQDIAACVEDGVVFVDQGESFDSVPCPKCKRRLQKSWWNKAMSYACGAYPKSWEDVYEKTDHEPVFSNLDVKLPCCDTMVSLNDLVYVAPAGFSRFRLEALYAPRNLTDVELQKLEEIVGCPIRQIWAHY